MKIPKCRMPKLVTTRQATGQKEFIGLTPVEWAQSCAALMFLYVVLAAFFAALLVIAQTIRGKSEHYFIPGTREFFEVSGDDE